MKVSNRKIHFFNPGHENAVWTGKPYYTPPSSVCKLMADLELLPAWYGNDNDYVIINETKEASRFLLSLPTDIRPSTIPILPSQLNISELVEAAPWGLSPHSIHFFETLRMQNENIVIPPWKERYKDLTGRQTALTCLSKIRSLLPDDFQSLIHPCFCSTTDEIRHFMIEHPPPYILKTPYSCSGRGLYRIQTCNLDLQTSRWIEGMIKKQGVISIECALDKVCDFAMEFVSDGNGNIRFDGLAIFKTLLKGTYDGNYLRSQHSLEKHLTEYIPIAYLHKIQQTVTSILAEVLGSIYRGYLGVDMLIHRKDRTFAIHPFIEINLRYTMGFVAMQLNHRFVHPSSQGQFVITFNKDKNKTYNTHLQMKEKYPLQLSGSKIKSGYLSLCPVIPETQYCAYILIES